VSSSTIRRTGLSAASQVPGTVAVPSCGHTAPG
jgi:hypothetical protein